MNILSTTIIHLIVGIFLFTSCKEKIKVIYSDQPLVVDSNTVFLVTYDKDGKVISYYMDEKLFDKKNMIASNSTLNDSLFYEVKKDSLDIISKIKTFKYSYITDIYSVFIKNDTVMLGEEFLGFVTSSEKNISLEVEDSISYKRNIEENNSLRTFKFSKKTDKLGIGKFMGKLRYNNKIIPFEYSYVVTSKPLPNSDVRVNYEEVVVSDQKLLEKNKGNIVHKKEELPSE